VSNLSSVEVVVGVDADDESTYDLRRFEFCRLINLLPLTPSSDRYNLMFSQCRGSIVMYCADDVIFATKGWDNIVRSKFREVSDEILLVFPPDAKYGDRAAPHGFISRRSVEVVGTFMFPGFLVWYCDTWFFDVYSTLKRIRCIPQFKLVHRHPKFFSGVPIDDSYRRSHFRRNNPAIRKDRALWKSTSKVRESWIKKLRAAMS
jgi:hypothetical protein